MVDFDKQLFTEIFRATKLENLVLTDRVRAALEGGIASQSVFLYGPQGTSKTTIARILVAPYETLRLNGSSENGIDIIRNKVVDFASTMSLDADTRKEKLKVIFIDEADGLTDQAWDALRETIEHYSDSVRYVCTCNRIDKIPAPIKSRFTCIPVYPINKEEEDYVFDGYKNYVGVLLNHFNISYDNETLEAFIRNSFPDMRTILNELQSLYRQHATELSKEFLVKTFDASDLFEVIVNGTDPVENYKFIMGTYATVPDEAMKEISRSFVDFIRMNYTQYVGYIPYLITTTAEYMAQIVNAPDKVLVLLACCFKLQLILHSN